MTAVDGRRAAAGGANHNLAMWPHLAGLGQPGLASIAQGQLALAGPDWLELPFVSCLWFLHVDWRIDELMIGQPKQLTVAQIEILLRNYDNGSLKKNVFSSKRLFS